MNNQKKGLSNRTQKSSQARNVNSSNCKDDQLNISPQLQKNKQNKLKLKQNISCLYSDALYKPQDDQLIKKMHIQKYRHLFQKEKREKMGLFEQVQTLKNRIKNLQQQKQTLNFAYKTLQIKRAKQEQVTKKSKRRSIIQKAKRNSIKYKNQLQSIGKSGFGDQNKSKLSSFCKPRQSFDCEFPELELIEDTLNQQQRMRLNNEQNSTKSWSKHRVECQKTEQVVEQEGSVVNEQEQFEEVVQQLIKKKNELINQLQGKLSKKQAQNYKLCEQVIRGLEVQKQLKERNMQVSEGIQRILKLEAQIEFHKQDSKQNLQMFENLKAEIQEKQKKQQKELQLLNRFSDQLKINDGKIRQFMNEEFGEDFNGCCNQKIVYKQKLSYLLHLTKKKQSLYEAAVADIKRALKQAEFRCELFEKKNEQTIRIYQRLAILAAKGQFTPLASFIQRSIK